MLAGCGDDESSSTSGGDTTREHGAALEHIHGLGVSAEGGRLFIATHNGLFSVAPGETTPQKVGDSSQVNRARAVRLRERGAGVARAAQ